MRPKEEGKTVTLLESLEYYNITLATARQAGLSKRYYSRRSQQISLSDATIAAVCLANRLTLITDNVKDFPMPELELYSLIDSDRNAQAA